MSKSPLPRSFYSDFQTQELCYYLGSLNHKGNTDYIFDCAFGQRFVSPDVFSDRFALADLDLLVPAEREIVKRIRQHQPKCTDNPVVRVARSLVGAGFGANND